VCNYTYYCSLRQAQTRGVRNWHSLFVHFPPFAIIGRQEQLSFAAELLDALMVASKGAAGAEVVNGTVAVAVSVAS
jgi:hypothetical protein